jgi:hypothetical protein
MFKKFINVKELYHRRDVLPVTTLVIHPGHINVPSAGRHESCTSKKDEI